MQVRNSILVGVMVIFFNRTQFLDYLRDLKEGGGHGGRANAMQMPSLPSHLSALPSIMSRLFGSLNNAAIVLVTILR